jgi:hypothetical protein
MSRSTVGSSGSGGPPEKPDPDKQELEAREKALKSMLLRQLRAAQERTGALPPSVSHLPLPVQTPAPPPKSLKREREDPSPPTSGEALTTADIRRMQPGAISRLTPQGVRHINVKDFASHELTDEQRSALRGVKMRPEMEELARAEQQTKQQADANIVVLKKARRNIELVGSWAKHYNGGEPDDITFRRFLDSQGLNVRTLAETLFFAGDLESRCSFGAPTRDEEIFVVTFDLEKYFDDRRLRNMFLTAGVTEDSVNVFHAGSGGR